MNTYKIEYTFKNYVGKLTRATEIINARNANTAVKIFKTNYSFCNTIHIEKVYKDEIKTEHGRMYKTGRKRFNVSHLECEICGHKEAVDDSFAGNWFKN